MAMGSVQAEGLTLVGGFEGGCFPQPPADMFPSCLYYRMMVISNRLFS